MLSETLQRMAQTLPFRSYSDDEQRWASIAATPECRRWWKHMGDVMPSNADNSPVSQDLREVFHLD